jgi:Na+-driven multidrug efflux pump
MWISIITSIAIRIPLAYGLVALTRTPDLPQGDCAMMYVSMLISWSLGAVISLIVYRAGRWQKAAGLIARG